jgi:mannosyltransferase OCH1-like enzyme
LRKGETRKEYQRRYQRRWRKLHPDYQHEWQTANREYVKLQKRKYRARKSK